MLNLLLGRTEWMLFIVCLLYSVSSQAENLEIEDKNLTVIMTELDAQFFDRGFNQCDLEYLAQTVTNDLSFYHDQSGYQDKEAFLEAMKVNVCGNRQIRPVRRLREGSLKVFPLKNNGILYGAIVHGEHDFFLQEDLKPEIATSSAKFTSVWQLKNNHWLLAEVLSYDHHDPQLNTTNNKPSVGHLLDENHIPLMGLGVIERGKISAISMHGKIGSFTDVNSENVFRVASLTKPVFALTVLKLVDAGLLGLDEPIGQYYMDADLLNDKRMHQLTPRIILSHQSGLPNWRYLTKSKRLEFEFDPGFKYQYSGEAFEILRKAIEVKLETDIESLVTAYVFKPAKMTHSALSWEAVNHFLKPVEVYDQEGNAYSLPSKIDVNAAASLITTVRDYSQFLVYLMQGADLSENLRADIYKEQVQIDDNNYFTLGWQKFTGFSEGEVAMVHSGSDPGVKTLAVFFPESGNGYVIFLNGDNSLPIYEYLLKGQLYKGKELWQYH